MLKPEWIDLSIDAQKNAYVPYSKFPVGAALVAKDGTVIQGCNIENASFGLTNCAERTAIFKAVSSGIKEFQYLVISGNTPEPISPCGACRQVIAEFCDPDMPVTLVGHDKVQKHTTVEGLLPYMFTSKDL
ncbi:MAG: cytidine deaminase [Streptococcaceae bacterium]|jgi:cytidine deaminase|nr:cytidine deaminase [Streptococcaceae bacterium]